MPVLQISAKIINWPSKCACCCGKANISVPVSFTKTKGVKVVREESKSWDVPYCAHCIGHMEAEQAIAAAQQKAEDMTQGFYMPRQTPGGEVMIAFCLALPVCGLVVFFIVPWLLMARNVNPVLAGFFALVFGGPLTAASAWLCWRWYRVLLAARTKRQDKADAVYRERVAEYNMEQVQAKHEAEEVVSRHRKMLRPGCAFSGLAVIYEGWHGTVHTFHFVNDHFAEAVAEANPGKVVKGQMG